MKKNILFRIGFITCLLAGICEQVFPQDAATLKIAADNFQQGYDFYIKRDFNNAVKYLLICNRTVPSALTYYFLGLAYSSGNDFKNASGNINQALSFSPALDADYAADARDMQAKLYAILHPKPQPGTQPTASHVGVKSDAVKSVPSGRIPNPGDNPYSANKLVINTKRFIFPGGGNKVQNSTIMETAVVSRSDGAQIGDILFYGFKGGVNIGNNRSVASALRIPLSGVVNILDAGSQQVKGIIEFNAANELFPGSVKVMRVGALNYKVTILSVQKYSDITFYMDRIRIEVDVH